MTITESDVRLRASVRMTDFPDGGGRMSTVVIVDGVDNNVFDDVTDLECLFGVTSLRKIFGAAANADTTAYLRAHIVVDIPPANAAISCWACSYGTYTTERSVAIAALQDWHRITGIGLGYPCNGGIGSQILDIAVGLSAYQSATPAIGQVLCLYRASDDASTVERVVVTGLGSPVSQANCVTRGISIDRALTRNYTGYGTTGGGTIAASIGNGVALTGMSLTEPRIYGVATSAGGIASGASTVTIDSVYAQVVPYTGTGDYPTTSEGIDPAPFAYSGGRVQKIRKGDSLLVSSTLSTSPTAASNGSTISTGRTNLQRLRVIGSNGTVHARFSAGRPPPSGVGCTADLAAGTVTFSDVTGMSNPVTVEHRIEELVGAAGVNAGTGVVSLNRALSRAYPGGCRVSSLMLLGTLQARVSLTFAQQAWTPGQFADSIVGGTPSGDYDTAAHPIEITNAGGITERWALFFSNNVNFRIIGETVGEIGTGNINSDTAINNPATGSPYFVLRQAGWGAGFGNGNVLRINTVGANAPAWIGRCLNPSEPGGDDKVVVELRGYLNV